MSLNLDQMRGLVWKGLGNLDSDDLPEEDVDLYLNMSLWDLESKYPFKEKECRIDTELVAGQEGYGLPTDLDAIVSVTIHLPNSTGTVKLKRLGAAGWDDRRNLTSSGDPTHYFRMNRTLYLWPVPTRVLPIQILMWKSVASLLAGEVEVPNLPRNWHEIIVQGAIVRGHFFNEDYNAAQQSQNFVVGQIRSAVPTDAKEERDMRFARVYAVDLDDIPDDLQRSSYNYYKSLYGERMP